jgi:magnesium-transporting ATPase (P-type)
LRGTIECDLPNRNLYDFAGALRINSAQHPIPISANQILLRGSKLKNTEWIQGVVIYSGHDTKLMMVCPVIRTKPSVDIRVISEFFGSAIQANSRGERDEQAGESTSMHFLSRLNASFATRFSSYWDCF